MTYISLHFFTARRALCSRFSTVFFIPICVVFFIITGNAFAADVDGIFRFSKSPITDPNNFVEATEFSDGDAIYGVLRSNEPIGKMRGDPLAADMFKAPRLYINLRLRTATGPNTADITFDLPIAQQSQNTFIFTLIDPKKPTNFVSHLRNALQNDLRNDDGKGVMLVAQAGLGEKSRTFAGGFTLKGEGDKYAQSAKQGDIAAGANETQAPQGRLHASLIGGVKAFFASEPKMKDYEYKRINVSSNEFDYFRHKISGVITARMFMVDAYAKKKGTEDCFMHISTLFQESNGSGYKQTIEQSRRTFRPIPCANMPK